MSSELFLVRQNILFHRTTKWLNTSHSSVKKHSWAAASANNQLRKIPDLLNASQPYVRFVAAFSTSSRRVSRSGGARSVR